jgi:hypothetical protein
VLISLDVSNGGRNYILPELKIRMRVVDGGGQGRFEDEQKVRDLLPGSKVVSLFTWNTGLYPPGDYRAVAEIFLAGQVVSNASALFKIDASFNLSGKVSITPSIVSQGNDARTDFTVSHTGNVDIQNLLVKVSVVEPETQSMIDSHETSFSLAMGATETGRFRFSTVGYSIRAYGVNLQYLLEGDQKTIASTTFTVKDVVPPEVSILSPAPESYVNSTVNLAVVANDNGSGIDRVEYRAGGGSWNLLPPSDPSQGRYSIAWVPALSDEGQHSFQFRAFDRSGNACAPVSTAVTIDLTPPSPPVIQSPADRSQVTSETVDISGIAEKGTTVEMLFGGVFKIQADSTTGEFTFKGIGLKSGTNVFSFTAKDRAGNVSKATDYTLVLSSSGIPSVSVILERGGYGANEDVLMTSTIGNTTASETFDDLTVRVSVRKDDGGVLYKEETQIVSLKPGKVFEFKCRWNTAANPTGHYTASLEVLRGASLLASATAGFDIVVAPVVTAIPAMNECGLIVLIGLLGITVRFFLAKGRVPIQAGKRYVAFARRTPDSPQPWGILGRVKSTFG